VVCSKTRRVQLVPVYSCSVPAVSVPVSGYRRVNGYTGMGLRRVGHLFLEKTRYTRTHLPAACVPVPVYLPPRTCTRTRTRRPVKFKFQKFPPDSHQINTCTRTRRTHCTKNRKKIPVYPYPCPWYPCTRDGYRYETGRVQF
jgi:hypothetical protein